MSTDESMPLMPIKTRIPITIIRIICVISIYSYIGIGFSQDYLDAGSWNTLNVEKEIDSKFTALFTEELRLKENFSRLNLFYTNLGIEYKINNNNTFTAYYLIQREYNVLSPQNLYIVGLEYTLSL